MSFKRKPKEGEATTRPMSPSASSTNGPAGSIDVTKMTPEQKKAMVMAGRNQQKQMEKQDERYESDLASAGLLDAGEASGAVDKHVEHRMKDFAEVRPTSSSLPIRNDSVARSKSGWQAGDFDQPKKAGFGLFGRKKEEKRSVPLKWPASASDYTLLAKIGRGAFAKVFRAKCYVDAEDKRKLREVAIKIIDLDRFDNLWDFIAHEIEIMSQLNHFHVVRIFTSFVADTNLWIVMPLHRGGSCADIMQTISPNGFTNEKLIASILKGAVMGLAYLHHCGHIHRDIKADNILISSTGRVQLADFGVAASLVKEGQREKGAKRLVGTPCWMAPEVIENGKDGYEYKADIWSIGITAIELSYGSVPYQQFPPKRVMQMVVKNEPPIPSKYVPVNRAPPELSADFEDFIVQCLKKDPKERVSAVQLLNHPFFKKAQDPDYLKANLIQTLPQNFTAPDQTSVRRASRKAGMNANRVDELNTANRGPADSDKPITYADPLLKKTNDMTLRMDAAQYTMTSSVKASQTKIASWVFEEPDQKDLLPTEDEDESPRGDYEQENKYTYSMSFNGDDSITGGSPSVTMNSTTPTNQSSISREEDDPPLAPPGT